MKTKLAVIALASALAARLCQGQISQPAVENFKPSTLNQPGKQYPQVNSDRCVRARVVAPQAQSVALDIGAVRYPLTKGEDGVWVGDSRPQDEGFHYYQLVIDGAQVPDPSSLYFYGASRWGSGVEVPAADQNFYALKDVPHGDLREIHYYSKNANANLRGFVYTPPDYEQKPAKRYPVLYLQHGGGEDDTGWGNQGHAGLIMDNLIADAKARPFIIVMANSYVPGSTMAGGPGRGGPGGGRGRGGFNFSGFEKVLIEDLIPFIDGNYRTLADQPHRAMAGLSMGGMQTRAMTMAHLDKFSHIGIFSGGSLGTADITDMAGFKEKVKAVFVSYGSKENGAAGRANVDALKQAGLNSAFYESPGTAHEWLTWRRSLHEFAPLLFQDQPLPVAYTPKPVETAAIPPAVAAAPPTAAAPAAPVPGVKVIRIKAGKSEPVKDTEGNVWLPDQGFEGGQTLERPDIQIANTKNPDLYRAERYSMDSFTWPAPNGKYLVKLHFAETFDGINGPGERVFSFNVQGREFKDFDVWVKAGGPLKAYVETVPVEVTTGAIKITFTPNVENPQINAIEIIPQASGETAAAPAPAKIIRIKAGQTTPFTDSNGNVWEAERGFEGGATIDRDAATAIANTKDPGLFLCEHYSMDSFAIKVPNGKYLAKLYFAETFDGVTGPGGRVFSYTVQGKEFKDFDIWAKTGGANKAYVESVPVEINNGEFKIVFKSQIENPEINAIELIPQASGESSMATPAPAGPPFLLIDAGKVTGTVSPLLYGLMTEEINFSYEGGIYGELVRNRTFKASTTAPLFWSTVGGAAITVDTNQALNAALNLSLKVDLSTVSKDSRAGIANRGYWGIPVRANTAYRASFYARADDFSGPLTISLETSNGETVFASAVVPAVTAKWQKYEMTLKTGEVKTSKDNRLVITTKDPGKPRAIWFQNVSLFPPTYHDRPNGTRPDLMNLLAEMQPKFLRFPGGNYLEGNTIAERFNWKETIGDVVDRPGHRSPWGYWSTDGFGLLEFLEWCEDLNMEPLLAVYAGYSLRQQYVEPGPKLEPYVQDALDEIEYIIGDANTTWGARRIKDGHPAPFPLQYVEVGNEDWFDRSRSYDGRFAQFYDAIKAKYPKLQVMATTKVQSKVPELLDEHYYRSQEDMQAHALDYDKYSRTDKTKIFVGEWATRVGSPTPNMAGALGDSAWMTGMERNSDIVLISCYAPLFVNVSQLTGPDRSMQWSSDLIGYDALTSYGSPAYYAQKLFSTLHGDEILATDSQNIPTRSWTPRAGRGGGQANPQQIRQVLWDATRDRQSGVIFLKVVNEGGTAQKLNVQIKGAPRVASEGEAVTLAATSLEDTNSLNDPHKIVPHTEKVDHLGAEFAREFPPYSLTILKLATR